MQSCMVQQVDQLFSEVERANVLQFVTLAWTLSWKVLGKYLLGDSRLTCMCSDHGCEYMTGGRVVILGNTGRNFGAGMSGGIAYVYDPVGDFATKCNHAMIGLETIADPSDQASLRDLLQQHIEHTQSTVASAILADWSRTQHNFVKVMPHDYKKVVESLSVQAPEEPAQQTVMRL
ncbi:hypothetical protein Ae201684_015210 [Aphanomyces euteiches]|uniref:Glutamate synthase alpha subunit C-terminal domain-containing protein n=1 Tax=Aphanomyces euteiches TaxID=100861 RepID=A0A6G0WHE8_9STRA|nr:hypothetical protein Ae201684_015210 [Aphanomyces euteiches]